MTHDKCFFQSFRLPLLVPSFDNFLPIVHHELSALCAQVILGMCGGSDEAPAA